MGNRRLLALFGLVFAIALAFMVPLQLLIAPAVQGRSTLALREASGHAWSGRLRGLAWGGAGSTTVDVALSPLPILLGERHWRLESDAFTATLLQGRARGLRDANGQVPFTGTSTPLRFQLGLQQADLVFRDGRCDEAGGQLFIELPLGREDTQDGPPTGPLRLEGPIACSGTHAVAELRVTVPLPTGIDRIESRVVIDGDGALVIDSAASSEVPAGRLALQVAGFESGPAGMTRQDRLSVSPRPDGQAPGLSDN